MSKTRIILIMGFAFLPSCATTTKNDSLSAGHPAHPAAPEAQVRSPSQSNPAKATAASSNAGPTTATDANETAGEGRTTFYTCPMHPEVQQPDPGQCPKCGMVLVKKQGEKKEKSDQP